MKGIWGEFVIAAWIMTKELEEIGVYMRWGFFFSDQPIYFPYKLASIRYFFDEDEEGNDALRK